MFVGEKIYPNALFYFDDILLTKNNLKIFKVLFSDINLSKSGQLRYIEIVNRYFRLIYEENNFGINSKNYKNNYSFHYNIIKLFFSEIEGFFEYCFDQNHLITLLDRMESVSRYYKDGVNKEGKSNIILKNGAEFLYNILYFIMKIDKVLDEDSFRMRIYNLYRNFIEIEDKNNKIAYNVFVEKLKTKIIGEKNYPNYQGYYPAMIKVYFYIFSSRIFIENNNNPLNRELHIPILSKLSESFPKLYKGYIKEFYDAINLPKEKKEHLENEGRKILNDFLPGSIIYNNSENSLLYYRENLHNIKIFLEEVRDKQKIKTEKI
jgi:hypothetical protein